MLGHIQTHTYLVIAMTIYIYIYIHEAKEKNIYKIKKTKNNENMAKQDSIYKIRWNSYICLVYLRSLLFIRYHQCHVYRFSLILKKKQWLSNTVCNVRWQRKTNENCITGNCNYFESNNAWVDVIIIYMSYQPHIRTMYKITS